MSKVTVKLNSAGIREFLKSDDVADMLNERADKVMSRLGEGYEQTTYVGKTRVNTSIKASTQESVSDQYQNNTILKALKG